MTCHFCHAKFPPNQTVEQFPAARSIAFDPSRGRLWAICPSCMRWSLAPFDSRWEALEDLERLTAGARTLSRSDNIALMRVGDVELVRIGKAPLREEAWWRYGCSVQERRRKAERIMRNGKIRDFLFSLAIGFPVWRGSATWLIKARNDQFGDGAFYGRGWCIECGRQSQQIEFGADVLLAEPDVLRARCTRCQSRGKRGWFELRGRSAQQVLRRMLAYHNFSGATDRALDQAVELIDAARGASEFAESVTGQHVVLRRLKPIERLALEIAVNDTREHELLSLEMQALEQRWREEEELAAIMDREFT